MGWPKSRFNILHNIKDTFFIFSNTSIDLGIFNMWAISPTWYDIDCSQLMSQFDTINFNWSTRLWNIIQREISSTKLHKPLLTHFKKSQHLLHTLHKSFFAFQLHFYFFEIIKHNVLKMLLILSSILKWLHKNSPIWFF